VSLTVLDDLLQGSEEWLEQRRGMLTASVISQLITPSTVKPANNDKSRGLVAQLVAERITGWIDPVFVTDTMLRGQDDEPRAVEVYSEHYSPVTTTGFMVREEAGWKLGYSPDGLVGDDGLIEVKSRAAKKQLSTVVEDEIPAENMAQCQTGLFVSGRKWLDYVSFCGGMVLYTKRTYPDPRWFDAIAETVERFEATATAMQARYEAVTAGMPMTERVIEMELTL
jgi:hypothetical protein